MKTMSAAAKAALRDGKAITSAAIKIDCDPPMLIWGGYGNITLTGVTDPFVGVGDRGLVTASGASLGDSEQNVTLSLSGVEPEVLAIIDASKVQRAPCKIWRLIFDSSGTIMLDAQVYTSGRTDKPEIDDTIGGTSTITVAVETAARGMGRSGQRQRTDADQRLVDQNDGAFSKVSYAGNKTLYWGGEKPTSASTLGWSPTPTPSNYGGYSSYD